MTAHVAEFFTLDEVNRLKIIQDVIDCRRGKPSNHQLPDGLARYALSIIRERYTDFGPTLACEKLAELHERR